MRDVENFSFNAQPPVSRDRIYISWSETWPLSRYIEDYLKSRRLRQDDAARAHVHQAIARYPWLGPLRKADVDSYLDSSGSQAELAVPEVIRSAGS
jgi:hypothetical protein